MLWLLEADRIRFYYKAMKKATETIKEKQASSFGALKSEFGYKNKMQAPRIKKVVISAGVGSVHDERKRTLIADRLTKITGQKPVIKSAKKSIASFKLREGDLAGYQITLRKNRAYYFLDLLFDLALPRMRDFRGIPLRCVDEMGNLTIGITEQLIFPQTSDEELKDIFGFGVTIVSTAKEREEAIAFF